jgi:hypothetical protein
MISESVREPAKRVKPTPVRLDDLDERSLSERIDAFIERVFNPPQKETPR